MMRVMRRGLKAHTDTHMLPGGVVLSPKSYVDVPAGPRKSDYLYTNFLPNFPPISRPLYHFRKKSTQFGSNWVLFTIICPKYTQFM